MKYHAHCLIFAVIALYSLPAIAQLTVTPFANGLNRPVDIANASDGSGRLFIVEKAGTVRILDEEGQVLNGVYLDITSKVLSDESEEGLLTMVFHPDFSANGYFFVYYTALEGNTRLGIIERYRADNPASSTVDPATSEFVYSVIQPQGNHNGGDLVFGPDGNLYLGLGDGGSGNDPGERSQNLTIALGKMIRINVDQLPYTIPADNPFATAAGDTIREMWAWGLRNPWRFSFDTNGDLWIGDVGQSAREEIDYVPSDKHVAGLNYGWDCREGEIECPGCGNDHCDNLDFTEPFYWYGPGPGLSVTGGYVMRGDYYQEFEGQYIFADYAENELLTLKITEAGTPEITSVMPVRKISTFGLDEKQRVYAANYSEGVIYQILEENLSTSSQDEIPEEDFHVLPNPASSYVSIYLSSKINTEELRFLSLSGALLKRLKFDSTTRESRFDISVRDLPRGVVLIELALENGRTSTRKIMLVGS